MSLMNKVNLLNIVEYMENKDEYLVFDVRSSLEYEEDSMLGAINIPILNNNERKVLGTIYKEKGGKAAKAIGMEFLLPKLPEFFKEFYKYLGDGSKKVMIYCARGGDRSEAAATLLSMELDNIYRLSGGYKSYRNFVLDYFNKSFNKKIKVFYGFTGSGKTEILKILATKKFPVIDLEGLANHRGSVFGHIGLGNQPRQKKFDSDLFNCINKIKEDYIIVEGESKKIGRLYIPEGFYDKIINGESYLISGSTEKRVYRIIEEYGGFLKENKSEIINSIDVLKNLLGKKITEDLKDRFLKGHLFEVVRCLLVNYYDILYKKNRKLKRGYCKEYFSDDLENCIHEIKGDLIRRRPFERFRKNIKAK